MEGSSASTARPATTVGRALGQLIHNAAAKLGGSGLHIYRGSYVDLVLAAESERGTVALVAGSHTKGFPYFDTEPWDNCLLLLGDAGYTFLTNLKAQDFAIKYEYVGVACPGDDGYGLVSFTSHTLFNGTILSEVLDGYLRRSASALMTIENGKVTDGNPRGVYSPSQEDPGVVLFENQVDLGPAILQRQMIKTRDKTGRLLHGLREIFTAKPELATRRTFHLNRAQVNVFLIALTLLDVVLSTVAIVFPEHWSQTFHGLPYEDPAGLLRRTGSVWVAFTLLQAIALFRWQKQPYWLPLIAGVRFTELFSDWVTIIAAKQMTTLGTIGLLISPPGNLIFGLILISTYMRMKSGPLPGGSFFTRPWS